MSQEQSLRFEVEDFLYHEAALLNEWKLNEWSALFTQDGEYLVPNAAADPYTPSQDTLYYIADDHYHLTERVKRLRKQTAHAESPRSSTRRLISNVRVLSRSPSELKIESSFITFRTNLGVTDTFYGRHEYRLIPTGNSFQIREKRTILDTGTLRPQGRLSVII